MVFAVVAVEVAIVVDVSVLFFPALPASLKTFVLILFLLYFSAKHRASVLSRFVRCGRLGWTAT